MKQGHGWILLLLVVAGVSNWITPAQAYAQSWNALLARGGAAQGAVAAIDAAGNSYVAGTLYRSGIFGSTDTLHSVGQADVFVAKLSPLGTVLWVVRGGGVDQDVVTAVAVDAAGHVYVAGGFSGTAYFGTSELTCATGRTAAFIAQMDAATGSWQWAWSSQPQTSFASVRIEALATDPASNVYATGGFFERVTFGPVTLLDYDGACFVISLDATGGWRWTQQGGESATEGRAMVLDHSGNLIIGGRFNAPSTWFGPHIVTGQGYDEVFIARIACATGSWQWATSAGGADQDELYGLALDPADGLYVSGGTAQVPMQLGAISMPAPPNAQSGIGDGFVAHLSASSGNWLWARRVTGLHTPGYTGIQCITAPTTAGAVVMTGFGGRELTLGSNTVSFDHIPAPYRPNLVIASLDNAGRWQGATAIGGNRTHLIGNLVSSGQDQVLAVGTTNSDTLYVGTTALAAKFSAFAINLRVPSGFPLLPLPEEMKGLWPNPARDQVSLMVPPGTLILVFDCLGQPVRTQLASDGITTLNLHGLGAGLYLMRTGKEMHRLVVESGGR